MVPLLYKFLGTLDYNILVYLPGYSGQMFHYTALKNIDSILLNPQGSIVLWASQFNCLNDMSEGTEAEKCYQQVCKELKEEGKISDEPGGLYRLLAPLKASLNKTFLIAEDGEIRPYRGEYMTYILSFSKNGDLLPMWNYYSKGDMFEGISLGMDAQMILSSIRSVFDNGKVELSVCPVIYDKVEKKRIIREFLLEIIRKYRPEFETSVRAIVSMKLTSWKMLFKQDCFRHEQEVRLIVDVPKKYSDVFPVKYRTNSGYIVPYIELKTDKTTMKSVTLGPFRGTENQRKLQVDILRQLLVSNGYSTSINCSEIPVKY